MGFTEQCRNGIELHKATYYELRAAYPDLPAQLVCAARVKATEAVKSALTWQNVAGKNIFLCRSCGYCCNADLNAAHTIRSKYLACVGTPSPADTHDTRGACCLLAGLTFFVPCLRKIWADSAYRGLELAAWCQATGEWELEVVERPAGTSGFCVVPRRWVVERLFSWISRIEE